MKNTEEIKYKLNSLKQRFAGWTEEHIANDALAYIDQLEETITLMKIQMHGDCGVCKHRKGFDIEGAIMSQRCYECLKKESRPNWEYEGLPEV